MAVSHQRFTVSTTPVALNTASTGGQKLTIKNIDATNAVDLGKSDVAAGAGFPLAATQTVTLEVQPQDVLFAIRSAAADVVLAVVRT